MTTSRMPTGFRLSIGHAMLAMVVIAVALAPLIEAVKSPSAERVFLTFVVETLGVPILITVFLFFAMKPGVTRDNAISKIWQVMTILYALPFLLISFLMALIAMILFIDFLFN